MAFDKRFICYNNVFLRTVAGLPRVQYEMTGIAAKYNSDISRCSTEPL